MLRLIIIIIILKQTYVECLNLYFRAHTKNQAKLVIHLVANLPYSFLL